MTKYSFIFMILLCIGCSTIPRGMEEGKFARHKVSHKKLLIVRHTDYGESVIVRELIDDEIPSPWVRTEYYITEIEPLPEQEIKE